MCSRVEEIVEEGKKKGKDATKDRVILSLDLTISENKKKSMRDSFLWK